eukprot:scaffold97129_cov63-Phaeocystis_antarctica.AAC.3
MQHDTNPLTGTTLPPGARNASALYPSLALRDATRAWEMEHGRSPTPRAPPLRPSPSGQESEFGEEEEAEGEEYGEEYGEEEEGEEDENEDDDYLEAVRQSLDAVAPGEDSEQPRDATEDERLLNLGREIASSRARYEERIAAITPADRESSLARYAARQAAITPAERERSLARYEARMAAITPAERERSLARYAARMAEREAASARYEQWRRQEVRQAAGAQWLAELAEQRESDALAALNSELAAATVEAERAGINMAAVAEAERGAAAPYHFARPHIESLLPGVAVTLHGLSGPRGEALNGRRSIWSKCRRSTAARMLSGLGRPTARADQREGPHHFAC